MLGNNFLGLGWLLHLLLFGYFSYDILSSLLCCTIVSVHGSFRNHLLRDRNTVCCHLLTQQQHAKRLGKRRRRPGFGASCAAYPRLLLRRHVLRLIHFSVVNGVNYESLQLFGRLKERIRMCVPMYSFVLLVLISSNAQISAVQALEQPSSFG